MEMTLNTRSNPENRRIGRGAVAVYDDVIVHQGVLDEGVFFIQKLFSVYGLSEKVRHVLDTE
ncbi:hypothetical protein KAH55_06360 [bacterium]|nr:hypothetical protein [bacterium]